MSCHSSSTPFYKGRILTSSDLAIRVGDEIVLSRKDGVGLKGQNCLERGDSLLWHEIFIKNRKYLECFPVYLNSQN